MRTASLTIFLILFPMIALAQLSPIEHVVAPGGKRVYYIMSTARPNAAGDSDMVIEEREMTTEVRRILVKSRGADDPKENLTGFSHLALSPDARTLYFEAEAWATSDAIHAINLATGKERFVVAGGLACVVLAGEYQGDLIVQQHRYLVQGGSYDALWLFDPAGKQLGMVAQSTDATGVCPILER